MYINTKQNDVKYDIKKMLEGGVKMQGSQNALVLEGIMINKSDRKRQIPYDFTSTWNLKNKTKGKQT